MLHPSTLSFLSSLKKNNNKPWFDEHRKEYEAARADVERMVQAILDAHAKNDPSIGSLKAKECIFRINRDIRFSKDKSPYKTNFGIRIKTGAKKYPFADYYVHIEPGGSFAGGGLYQPEAKELKMMRQEIDYNLEEFRSIVESKKFKSVFGTLDNDPSLKISRVPKDFDKDSPAAEYLKYKSYIAFIDLPDEMLTDKKLVKRITDAFVVLQPMLSFINRSME